MNKSDKFFRDFFDSKKENLSFITLKNGGKIKLGDKEFAADRELDLPIRIDSLVEDIKNQDEYDGIAIGNIIDGIIYVLGVEENFEFKEDYLKLLKSLGIDLIPFVIHCINKLEDDNSNDAVVFGKCLINVELNVRTAFVYASALERKSIEAINKGNQQVAKYCMDESMKFYEKCLDFDERFALAYYKLGYYYKNNNQYVKAKLYWEKQQEYDDDQVRIDEIRNEIEQLEVYVKFETGYNYVLQNEPKKGLELLLPLVENYSGWWNLLFFVGLAYRILGEYEIAERYFENVLTIEEGQNDALNELGICKMCLGKYEKALEIYGGLISLNPKNTSALCNRAGAYLYLKDEENARKDINKVLEMEPNDGVALELLKIIEDGSYK